MTYISRLKHLIIEPVLSSIRARTITTIVKATGTQGSSRVSGRGFHKPNSVQAVVARSLPSTPYAVHARHKAYPRSFDTWRRCKKIQRQRPRWYRLSSFFLFVLLWSSCYHSLLEGMLRLSMLSIFYCVCIYIWRDAKWLCKLENCPICWRIVFHFALKFCVGRHCHRHIGRESVPESRRFFDKNLWILLF